MFDINGDKSVSHEEIVAMLSNLRSIDEEAVERATREIETRIKDSLTFKEFAEMI
jgi:Ca2+-binding EF-hand superfamily protein